MNRYSSNTGSCSCQRNISVVEDYLRCAPCPPPMMSYEEFRNHTLNMLPKIDMCIISKRCIRDNSTAYAIDCPASLFDNCPETTTKSKDPIVDASFNVTIVVIISITFAVIVIIIVVFIVLRRKGKCRCKCNDESVLCLSGELGCFEKSTKGTYSEASQETEDNQLSNMGEPDEDENEAENKGAERNITKTVETIEIEVFHDVSEPNMNEHSETRDTFKNDSDSDSDSKFEMALESVV